MASGQDARTTWEEITASGQDARTTNLQKWDAPDSWVEPQEIAERVLNYIENPDKLEEMRSRLRAVRGQSGAAQKLAQLVWEELN